MDNTLDESNFEDSEIKGILNHEYIKKLNPFMVNNNIGIGLISNEDQEVTGFIFQIKTNYYIGQVGVTKENGLYSINFLNNDKKFKNIQFHKVIPTVLKELPMVNICLN